MHETTLGQVLKECGGSIKTGPFGTKLAAREYSADGAPVISVGEIGYGRLRVSAKTKRVPNEVVARMPEYLLEAGDVVFGRKGAVDRSAWVRDDEQGFFLGSDGIRLRFGPGVDSRFMAYQLRSLRVRNWILQHAVGTTLASLNEPTLKSVPLSMPSLVQQRAIAATLGALDDKIDSNRRVIAIALDLASSHVKHAIKDRDFVPYGSAIQVRMGAAFKGSFFSPPSVGRPLLRIRDLKTFESQTWTTEIRPDETSISPGDIVVGMDAEFRATLWLGEESVLNQRVCSFVGLGEVGRAFVIEALKPELAFQEQAKTGTTVIHLNKSDIDAFTVPCLTASEHRQLSMLTEPLVDLAVARANETTKLVANRDLLLPMLFAGRVCVPAEATAS